MKFGWLSLLISRQAHAHYHGRELVVMSSPAEMTLNGHFGLAGMFERAQMIGAEMSVVGGDSAESSGTLLTVSV